jgi:hypothetical protein
MDQIWAAKPTGHFRVPLVGLLPALAFAKSQKPNQRG